MTNKSCSILIVDDNEDIRNLLARQIRRQGQTPYVAGDGLQALALAQAQEFDLILLDIMMPGMNGYQVLEHLKANASLRHVPVIMISALDEIDSVVRCIELGAEDYLFKPISRVLLRARLEASLEKKWLRDQEQAYLVQLQVEREKSDRLLLNILPEPIAERLKRGQGIIADRFEEATVLFADIVDFTRLWLSKAPSELVALLNDIFFTFDRLAEQHGVEKIKTIGDAYMVAGGLPTPRPDHAEAVAEMALAIQSEIARFSARDTQPLQIRIGIASGPVVAGVIGKNKFSYDLWGDTVNTASRMQTHGIPGQIQVTEATYRLLREKYDLEARGLIELKNLGTMPAYILKGRLGSK
jgi:class 3 adenylate cyclase